MVRYAGSIATLVVGEVGFGPCDGVLDMLPALGWIIGRVAFGFFALFCFG